MKSSHSSARAKNSMGLSSDGDREVLLIQLSGDTLKVLYGIGGSPFQLTHADSLKLKEDDTISASRFLLDCMKRFKVKKRRALIVLPTSVFICKNMDMPSDNRDEIAKIIELQAGRFTPYSADEIVIDYQCHVVKDQHYTHVLLFIVHRQVVDRYVKILQGAGLELAGLRAGAEALAGRIRSLGYAALTQGALGLLHVSSEGSNFLIFDQGHVVFVRSFPTTLQDLDGERESAREEFSAELAKSMSAYQDVGFGRPLAKLLISGSSAAIKGLSERLADKEALPEIQLFDGFQNVKLTAAAQDNIKKLGLTDFTDLVSAGAEMQSFRLDFTPREIRAKQKIRQESRDLAGTAVLVMTVVLLISFYFFGKIHFKTLILDKLDEVNASTFEEARYLERVSTKSRAVRNLLEGRGKGLYVFNKISELFGEEIYLREFTYDLEGNLVIKGTANSMSQIFAFVKILEESTYFESVKTNETQSRREGKKEVADFDITGKLKEGI